MGNPVFTNEAARDAVITAPSEGQRAYLTAATIPAATATTYQAVPSGVQTIYNGSVWVCITEIGAHTDNPGTHTSLTYTATLSGSPGINPSVTLVTGTSALVTISANQQNGTISTSAYTSFAVSGATTLAASDEFSVHLDMSTAGFFTTLTRTVAITGLTAGTNTFTLNYRRSAGTFNVNRRSIVVKGIA
jgi:hypothetical protein